MVSKAGLMDSMVEVRMAKGSARGFSGSRCIVCPLLDGVC